MRRNNVFLSQHICLTEQALRNSRFHPPDSRSIDSFSRSVMYTAHMMFAGNLESITNKDTTGAVISTRTGNTTSIKKVARIIHQSGYRGINPSLFPNVMLSTALSRLTRFLDIHGPACVLYDIGKGGENAFEYCTLQLTANQCSAMVMIRIDEGEGADGWYYTRKD